MKTSLASFENGQWVSQGMKAVEAPDFVLAFLSPDANDDFSAFDMLCRDYPDAVVLGCSSAGEVLGRELLSGSAVASFIKFKTSTVRMVESCVNDAADTRSKAIALARGLKGEGLKGVFILADGLNVNGTDMITGFREVLGETLPIVGGIAGDEDRFGTTFVGANSLMEEKRIAAVGFYGDDIVLHHGCKAGWDDFGPDRKITRCDGNVLYELNGLPALDLYKRYLGDDAKNLPSSGVLYPLKVYPESDVEHDIIRTVQGVDEEEKSLILGGNIKQGSRAKLMIGHYDHLISAAGEAAAQIKINQPENALSIVVSCVGRRLLMGEYAREEVLEVNSVLNNVPQIGFYSYGEISHHHRTGISDIHNQTMSVAVIEEKVS